MPAGTVYSRSIPHIWHKKFVEMNLDENAGGGLTWVGTSGTQCNGQIWGLKFQPTVVLCHTNWAMSVPADWDGTSNFVLRTQWVQIPIGDQSSDICYWDFSYWVCRDWDNALGSKSVVQSATYTYGDEGTTNYCMHCGTFQMDFTGGTFGTVAPGNTLFMSLKMPQGASPAATALLYRASVEYMAHYTGPGDAAYTTQDQRGG